jgi:glutamyl endopeptidase
MTEKKRKTAKKDNKVDAEDRLPFGEATATPPEYGDEDREAAPLLSDNTFEPVEGYDPHLLEVSRREVAILKDEARVLDAWYATYGDGGPLTETAPTSRQSYAPITQTTQAEGREVIVDIDDRKQIPNTTVYPWRCICALRITARDGSRWSGTGWFAGPYIIITAGHCVYLHDNGGWARQIEVIPGCNGVDLPYGSSTSTRFRSVGGWINGKQNSHDYGAILLPHSYDAGERIGCFGYVSLESGAFDNLVANISGYPGDKPPFTQWFAARSLDSITPTALIYNIATMGGQSGTAVFAIMNGQRYVVGIHTNGSSTGNSAVRITQSIYDNINSWRAEAS